MAIALWEVGNEIGADRITRETWLEGMGGFTGPVFLGPREVSCPGRVFPSVCGKGSRVFQIVDGEFVDATDGQGVVVFPE
jgi:hypothetical protein